MSILDKFRKKKKPKSIFDEINDALREINILGKPIEKKPKNIFDKVNNAFSNWID